ncbi:MAG: transposase, partial [Bacillota bacterium]
EIIPALPYTRPRTKEGFFRKQGQKVVTRHIWQTHVEEADHLRHHHHQDVKPIYTKRKETIERVFADAKEKHG